MKLFIFPLFVLLVLIPGLASCGTDEPDSPPQAAHPSTPEKPNTPEQPTPPDTPSTPEQPTPPGNGGDGNGNEDYKPMSNKLAIRVGSFVFTATLEENAAARAFCSLLPLTLDMAELNGNEKFFYLSANLPLESSRPGTIRTGDLMLYGSNCLVLFYETFSSSYSYTRLGRVDDPSGLAAALGDDRVTVIFEVARN